MNTDLTILLQILEECLWDSHRFSYPIFLQVQIINPPDPEPAQEESFNQTATLNFKIQGIKPIYFVLKQKTEITSSPSGADVQRTYLICNRTLTTFESVRQTLNNQILPPNGISQPIKFKHNVYFRIIIPLFNFDKI